MIQLVIGVFILLIGFNSYRVAKRQGQWSWLKFLIAIASAVAIPLLIVVPLATMPWLKDKPALATLLMVGLIFLFVAALVYFTRKFSPTTKKSAP
jgi:predicted permease